MLLISFTQILPWLFGGLCILISLFSIKGTLSPKFTILLLVMLGVIFFFTSLLSSSKIETLEIYKPINFVNDNAPIESIPEKPTALKPKSTEKEINTPSIKEVDDTPIDKNLIPQEYEVIDKNLWTYKTSGSWKWDKSFEKYFETETGWRKIKKGNAEIIVEYTGSFTQANGEDERLYIFSGGEIEIKVNGKICCCENIVSIPEGISHSQLVKAKVILQDTISNLIMENKQKIVIQLQKCL